MNQIEVGDWVRVNQYEYQPVYGFGHFDNERQSLFYQIWTTQEDSNVRDPLELSADHLVFRHGEVVPVPASKIQIGDRIQQVGYGGGKNNTDVASSSLSGALVTQINKVARSGIYAPFTASGTIIVSNGLVASTFVTFQPHEAYMVIGGISTGWSYHTLSLLWNRPFAFSCTALSNDMCRHQIHMDGGVALWSYLGKSLATSMFPHVQENPSSASSTITSSPWLTVLQGVIFVVLVPILLVIFALVFCLEHTMTGGLVLALLFLPTLVPYHGVCARRMSN